MIVYVLYSKKARLVVVSSGGLQESTLVVDLGFDLTDAKETMFYGNTFSDS